MDLDNDEEELYSRRLREVFDSCDLDGKGYINRNEVIDLSQKLQCGDQVPELLRETLGDEFTDGQVTFDQFRDGFVTILARTIDGLGDDTEDDHSESEFDFGRDQFVPDNGYVDVDDDIFDTCGYTKQQYNHLNERKTSTPRQERQSNFRDGIGVLCLSKDEDTVKDCGIIKSQFHEKCCISAKDSIVCGKATQIRQIWDEIAVGQSGSINLLQLSTICDHIGMDSMNGDELEMLFRELDTDGDGLVSLEEFLNGLFGVETPRLTDELDGIFESCEGEEEEERTSSTLSADSKKRKLPTVPAGRPKISNEEVSLYLLTPENLSVLDLNNSGTAALADIRKYLQKHHLNDVDTILKSLIADVDGNVKLTDLIAYFEKIVCSESLPKAVLQTYKSELSQLRGRLESTNNEVNILKNNLSKLECENSSIIFEGDDQMRNTEAKYEEKLKKQETAFIEKISLMERELIKLRESAVDEHVQEIEELEQQNKQLKTDLVKTKDKLQEADTENTRLEYDLKNYTSELDVEKKRYTRMEKELSNNRNMKEKVGNLELQLNDLSEVRYKEANRMEELEKMSKELQDQNDEYVSLLKSRGNEGYSNDSSCLSEYFKPAFLGRNEYGESYDEHQSDGDKKNAIIYEQEASILTLRRDLENVNRLLEENMANSNERHFREINYLTNKHEIERDELKKLHAEEKEGLIESYETKIIELRQHLFFENQNIVKEMDVDSKNCGGTTESMVCKRMEELEISYRSQLNQLQEKVIILETENAEMELNFLNEKAELEQKFRIDRAELEQNESSTNREIDRLRKYIDFLKDDSSKKHTDVIEEMQRINKKEKQDTEERMQKQIEEKNMEHQRGLIEVRKSFNNHISELEKTFTKERASLREGFLREKSESEQKYLRERAELEDYLKQEYELEIATKLSDLRKSSVEERTILEENLRQEKYESSIGLQHEKASAERNIRHIKTEMEISYTEEKNQLIKDFEYEKNLMQNKCKQEIAELQQAFSGGEAGLKGKMKDDFSKLIEQRRREWQISFAKEKSDLLESFAREKGELESGWQEEKCRLEKHFEEERKEWETIFQNEKQELVNRFQKQKQILEDEFLEETKNLKESRDAEMQKRAERETEILQYSGNHLESELISLRQQKKELETKNQILELKHLSQKQEAAEINTFQNEKEEIHQIIDDLTQEVSLHKSDKLRLQIDLQNLASEKATILDNSVQEITQQQEQIVQLQGEKEVMQGRIDHLCQCQNEAGELKRENARLAKDCCENRNVLQSLSQMETVNKSMGENIKLLEQREQVLQASLQEKLVKISRLENEKEHYVNKLETLEMVNKKEIDTHKERLNMQAAATSTERSRYLRELNELKEQLHHATLSSDRDSALKEQVFNDAKSEVMILNKKLEEKTRKIRMLEGAQTTMEEKRSECQQLEGKVKSLKTLMNDKELKTREERNNLLTKSIRSDTLVTDLYLENADLMKQIANAENSQSKAEKQVRQLTDQKRALQRVISKLCHANGISSEESTSPPP